MSNYMMNTAYQMGAYRAIAGMMRDAVRELNTAEDDYDRKWAERRLTMLAEQMDEAEAKFQEVAA